MRSVWRLSGGLKRGVESMGDRANFFADFGNTDGPGRFIFNGHQDIKPSELEVQIGNRGCFVTAFETRGRSAHSRRPNLFRKRLLVQRVKKAVELGTGEDAVTGGCPAITIAMVLTEMGIPAVICGPGSIAQAHTEDEWVEIDQIKKAARVYTALMAGM